jgi:hypothetical protein
MLLRRHRTSPPLVFILESEAIAILRRTYADRPSISTAQSTEEAVTEFLNHSLCDGDSSVGGPCAMRNAHPILSKLTDALQQHHTNPSAQKTRSVERFHVLGSAVELMRRGNVCPWLADLAVPLLASCCSFGRLRDTAWTRDPKEDSALAVLLSAGR